MATKTWKIEKDLCRCCHAEGAFDNLSEPRIFLEKEEVYSDMLRECLDIDIPVVPGELSASTYTICNTCIGRLRDACNFKKQVQDCEQRFMTLYYKNAIQGLKPETKVKEELEVTVEDSHSDMEAGIVLKKEDTDDDDHLSGGGDDDDMSEDDLPIKRALSIAKTRPKPKPKPKAPPVKKEKPPPKPKKKAEEPKPAKEKKGEIKKTYVIQPGDLKHVGDKYLCQFCEKSYSNKCSLNVHVRRYHYNTYECPYCELKFARMTPFTVHKLDVHNVDDRLACNACNGRFNSQLALDKHIKVFHMVGKKYACKLCDFETYSRHGIYKHQSKHKTVKDQHCRFCKKSFARRQNLKLHEKIHTNERGKVCRVCGQAFVQKASLNYHMTRHHPDVDF